MSSTGKLLSITFELFVPFLMLVTNIYVISLYIKMGCRNKKNHIWAIPMIMSALLFSIMTISTVVMIGYPLWKTENTRFVAICLVIIQQFSAIVGCLFLGFGTWRLNKYLGQG